jgi:hypothetical protein
LCQLSTANKIGTPPDHPVPEISIIITSTIAAIGVFSLLSGVPILLASIYQSPSEEPDVLTDFAKIYNDGLH